MSLFCRLTIIVPLVQERQRKLLRERALPDLSESNQLWVSEGKCTKSKLRAVRSSLFHLVLSYWLPQAPSPPLWLQPWRRCHPRGVAPPCFHQWHPSPTRRQEVRPFLVLTVLLLSYHLSPFSLLFLCAVSRLHDCGIKFPARVRLRMIQGKRSFHHGSSLSLEHRGKVVMGYFSGVSPLPCGFELGFFLVF